MAQKPLQGLETVGQKLDQSSSTESLRLQLCQHPHQAAHQSSNWVSPSAHYKV